MIFNKFSNIYKKYNFIFFAVINYYNNISKNRMYLQKIKKKFI